MSSVTSSCSVTLELGRVFVIHRLRRRAALQCSGKRNADERRRYVISLYQIGMRLDVIMLGQKLSNI